MVCWAELSDMICKGAGVGEMLQVIRRDCARHNLGPVCFRLYAAYRWK